MQDIQTTSIIRQRGQLTIPDSIRNKADWVTPGSVVNVSQVKPDEIIIKPYSSSKKVVWATLWKQIKRVRSFKGKGKKISLSEFISRDRETHF